MSFDDSSPYDVCYNLAAERSDFLLIINLHDAHGGVHALSVDVILDYSNCLVLPLLLILANVRCTLFRQVGRLVYI